MIVKCWAKASIIKVIVYSLLLYSPDSDSGLQPPASTLPPGNTTPVLQGCTTLTPDTVSALLLPLSTKGNERKREKHCSL